jgi:hypothetical protein
VSPQEPEYLARKGAKHVLSQVEGVAKELRSQKNSKLEIRNSKQIQMIKKAMFQTGSSEWRFGLGAKMRRSGYKKRLFGGCGLVVGLGSLRNSLNS